MQAQPRLAVVELSKERQTLWQEIARTHVVDELLVRRLRNKFDSLLVNPSPDGLSKAVALHEQAYLYAYQMKTDVVIKLFEDSERAGFPSLAKSISKAHALYICGELALSRKEIENVRPDDSDKPGIAGAAGACVHAGLFCKARDLYLKAGLGQEGISKRIVHAAKIIDGIGATDADVADRLSIAGKIVQEMSAHPLIAYDLFAMEGEGILFRFMIRDSIDRLVEIDRAIDEALTDKFDAGIDRVFSIGVTPHTVGAPVSMGDEYHVCL